MELTPAQQTQLTANIHCGVLTKAEATFIMCAVEIAMQNSVLQNRIGTYGFSHILSACERKGSLPAGVFGPDAVIGPDSLPA